MIAQGTPEWMAQRAGKFTASRAADLMARTKSGPSASRANLITLLAVERLTGQCVETYQNDAMRRGTELEPEARELFEFVTGYEVEQVGFIEATDLPNTGCSPDGLIGKVGMLEIKCPSSMQKHLDALRKGAHADEYHWQLVHQLMVTKREFVSAVSYDPRFPNGLRLVSANVFADKVASDIEALRAEIIKADAEVEAVVAELRAMKGGG